MRLLARVGTFFRKPEYLWRPWQIPLRALRSVARSRASERVCLPWGFDLDLRPNDAIGAAIWNSGVYDLAVTETLWRLTNRAELAVDVGANIGYTTSVLATRVGSNGEVWSFEPHPRLFKELEDNVANWASRNEIRNVRVFDLAVSDRKGPGRLIEPPGFASNQGTATLAQSSLVPEPACETGYGVNTTTLDAIIQDRRVGVLKIDVEGRELEVLKGARLLLKQSRIRDIVFEDFGSYPTSSMSYLKGFEYTIFALSKNLFGPRLIPPMTCTRMDPWEVPSFLATLQPESAILRMQPRGWRCLRGH